MMPHAGKFKPYIQSLQTVVTVHMILQQPQAPGKTTGTVLSPCVNIVGEPPTTPGKSVEPQEWSATIVTGLDI